MLAFASATGTGPVGAQFAGTLSAVSDYRYRGVSLSQQKPALQASLDYDDSSGFYGGLFGSTVELAGGSAMSGQALAYLGWVAALGGGFHWDMGGNYSAFADGREYDYGEVYVGITASNFSVRLHYSRDYFGSDQASWYSEVNGTVPLADSFALFGHIGLLVPSGQGGDTYAPAVRNTVDARVGIGRDFAGFNIQVAWVGNNGSGASYPLNGTLRRNTVVASVAWAF